MIDEKKSNRAHIDVPLLVLVFGMAIFGVYIVTVATYSTSGTAGASFLTHLAESNSGPRQLLYLMAAPVIVGVLLWIRYEWLRRYARAIYIATTVVVLVVWLVNRAAGVKQWLDIIWGFTIQPTEFAKLALILMLARYLSGLEDGIQEWKQVIPMAAIVVVPGAIIIGSGEMGSFIVIAVFTVVMYWFSGSSMRIFWVLGALVLALVAAWVAWTYVTEPDNYRLLRLLAFINPEAYASDQAYQQTMSKVAIGAGGLTGVGAFRQGALYQLNYVPADWTDFVFATVGEAGGLRMCVGVLLVYFLILLRILYLAFHTRDRFGMLVICGVFGMLLIHVVENIGMTLGLLPITGIPLPFLSYGGSNMVTNMAGIGLVLNVTKNRSVITTLPAAHVHFAKRPNRLLLRLNPNHRQR